ncbi:hypothetical protein [Bacillus salipaludis]|uniref:Uncharacterized protein n=1 Tax=Bacillus salipaludis TaxID=2547811 RepID=A0AA90ZAF3_9BACI|nr:hypothetical protein [Bacillus salipaludis]MDQ6600746.1 hypothetical protein [Bacillus salipaludis]
MYKLQFVNAYTSDILREVDYEKPDIINSLIEQLEERNSTDVFLMDSQQRLFRADYVSCKEVNEQDNHVYKFFFKVKLHNVQPILARRN